MKITRLLFVLLLSSSAMAQTWSDDVAEIVYNKCSKCHHTGGIAPFPLITYQETSNMSAAINTVLQNDEMPPWPPNNAYQSYAHDRSLSTAEKITMLDWILNGTPEGNAANTPPPPVFQGGSSLGPGDLEVKIPTYMSKALTSDDYACFAIPSNLAANRKIKAVEIVPGNPEIVHHALIYVDPNSNSVTDTIGGDCGGPSSATATLVMGYTPGSSPLVLPSVSPLKLGMTMPANSQIYFAMHYPMGSYGQYDSTKVIFHFYPPGESNVREVSTAPVLQNWSFVLPPDQVTQVNAQYPNAGGLPANISLLSVFPHMHLLGESMRVFGIKPNLDTLKLIHIPQWDFHWQDFYFYKNIQKADAGTTLKVEAIYNNTDTNLNNPNSPPITVTAGLNTTDEMCMVYMHYMNYQNGDELHNMDSLLNLSVASIGTLESGDDLFLVYPNPFDTGLEIRSDAVRSGDVVSLFIYDNEGRVIRKLIEEQTFISDGLNLSWDGCSDAGDVVRSGIYHISVNRNGSFSTTRVVRR